VLRCPQITASNLPQTENHTLRIHCILSQSLALFVTVAIGNVPGAVAEDSTTTISLKPVPTGVVELINVLNNRGSVIERADGALMHVNGETYQLSTDGGRTWGDDQPLGSPFGALGAIRLQSGALAIYGGDTDKASYFSSSTDEETILFSVGDRSLYRAGRL
jgi:hypothetical protein